MNLHNEKIAQETDYGRQKRKPRLIIVFSRQSSIQQALVMSACDRYIQGYFFFSEKVKSKWTRTQLFFLVNCNLCYLSMV